MAKLTVKLAACVALLLPPLLHAAAAAAAPGRIPSIKIRGANPLKVGVYDMGHDYLDAGADCTDSAAAPGSLNAHLAVAGDLVDLTAPGTYRVQYFCDNRAGIVNATRTVVVNAKFNPGCEKLRVSGPPGSSLSQMGTYDLVQPGGGSDSSKNPQLSDGKPIYVQTDGCKCNHIYFLANEKRKTHEWFVDTKAAWRRTQAQDNQVYLDDRQHVGLRAYAWAPRPEDIRKTWQLWDPRSSSYGDVPDVHVHCHEKSRHKGSTDAAKYHISAAVQLVGIGLKQFTERREYEFCAAAAEALDVAVEDVHIVEIVDDFHFGRRRLQRQQLPRRLSRQQHGLMLRRRLLPAEAAEPAQAAQAAQAAEAAEPARAAGMLGVTGLAGVRVHFEVSTLFRVVEKGVVRKLYAETFQETLFDALDRAGLRERGMRLIVDGSSVKVRRPVGSGAVVEVTLALTALVLAVVMLLSNRSKREQDGGGGGCCGGRRAAKTFNEAGCSTDDLGDFGSINEHGELDVCLEESIPLTATGGGGAAGSSYQDEYGSDYGSDDDAL